MPKYNFIKVVSTIEGAYRNTGVRHNFRDMREVKNFVELLEGADLSSVHAIRIVPEAVSFTTPDNAANAIDGNRGRGRYS
jgi:hypothetical protein